MEPKVKRLVHSIEDLEKELKHKECKLENIRKDCSHVWPKEWSEKAGRDYHYLSGAVGPVLRCSTPEIITVQYKICEACGKEITRE